MDNYFHQEEEEYLIPTTKIMKPHHHHHHPVWVQQVLQEKKALIDETFNVIPMAASNKTNNHNNTNNLASFHPKATLSKILLSQDSSKIVDAVCAQEMNQMSLQERNRVYEELHGCDEPIAETPDFVREKVHELELELQDHVQQYQQSQNPTATSNSSSSSSSTSTNTSTSSSNTTTVSCQAYWKALKQGPEYITSIKFRLMFLRADNFDTQKAAIRMLWFCQRKEELFGSHTLGRPLYWQDLTKDDIQALKAGYIQVLPSRDRAGRAVYVDFQNCFPPKYPKGINQVRVWIFTFLSALEDDDETQKRGFVILLYHMGALRNDHDPLLLTEGPKVNQWLPIKPVGIHMCMDDPLVGLMARIIQVTSSPDVRSRFRLHQGTPTECQYKLMTFGIPVETIPLNSKGRLKLRNHLQWMERKRIKDQFLFASFSRTGGASSSSLVEERLLVENHHYPNNNNNHDNNNNKTMTCNCNWIELPCRNDVIAGRGKHLQSHPGNVFLRVCVDKLLHQYVHAKKVEKGPMVNHVLHAIQAIGGRFLKKQPYDGNDNNTSSGSGSGGFHEPKMNNKNNNNKSDEEGWWVQMSNEEAREKIRKTFTSAQAALKGKLAVSSFSTDTSCSSSSLLSTTTPTKSAAYNSSTTRDDDYDYTSPLSKKIYMRHEKSCFGC